MSVEVLIALIGNPALKHSHLAHNEVEPVVEGFIVGRVYVVKMHKITGR